MQSNREHKEKLTSKRTSRAKHIMAAILTVTATMVESLPFGKSAVTVKSAGALKNQRAKGELH